VTTEPADLYALPLEEFTKARDGLAAELKRAGDDSGARQVKSLRKPTVAAWAVNQVARRHAKEMSKLLSLRAEMESASAADLRALGDKRRRLLAELTKRADAILRDAGHGASSGTLDKVTQTLQAGSTDEELELLREGRLARELAPAGFAGIAFSDAMTSGPGPSKAQERAQAKADELASKADEAERAARELERAAEVARKHAAAAAREAEVARRNADRARARADAAANALD
jgi:hypothetical protein